MPAPRPPTLNFITSNAGKLREASAFFQGTVDLQSRGDVDVDEIQGSIEEIARDKCSRAAAIAMKVVVGFLTNEQRPWMVEAVMFGIRGHEHVLARQRKSLIFVAGGDEKLNIGGPVLTEDTALEFQALKGLPGPYIKYFLAALGHDGLNNLLAAYDDKTIFAVCTFAYCAGPGQEAILFQGKTEGKLVPARGPANFGWDPCFEYEGKTYAEMTKEEKNEISHRGKALIKLRDWLARGDPEP